MLIKPSGLIGQKSTAPKGADAVQGVNGLASAGSQEERFHLSIDTNLFTELMQP